MALTARGRAPALPPGAAPSEVTFELGQGVQLRLAALAAELRRALGALLPLRLAHRFPGEAVHFLRGRDGGGVGSPRRRRRRRHRRGPGAWQLRLLQARNGQRQEEEAGERRGELAPLRPVPPGRAALPLRGAAELLPAAAASRPHLSAGGSWSPPRGHLPGLTEARAGAEGGEEVVDFGRGGRVEESLKFGQLRRGRGGADAECASLLFSPVRQPAGWPLSGRCQCSQPCLEPPPEALPSRVPSEPPPLRPLFPVSAGPSSPGAVTRRPGSGRAHTRFSRLGAVQAPSPTRPSAAHGEPPASDRYNLRRWRVHAGVGGGNVCACARALGRAARRRGLAGGGEGGD